MNEIEKMFCRAHDALLDKGGEPCELMTMFYMNDQFVIGIYKVDFLIGKCAIEIDGYEFHKTKEQREHDYKRERYILKQGYIPVRFTGTEVFLNAEECVLEAFRIAEQTEMNEMNDWMKAVEWGEAKARGEMVAK